VIGFAGEQRPGFEFGDERLRAGELAIEILQQIVTLLGVGFFARQRNIRFDVAGNRGELGFGGNLVFGAFAVAQDSLRRGLIVPEIGLGNAGFQRFQSFAVLRSVKENSGPS